jgi:hypothetical protein
MELYAVTDGVIDLRIACAGMRGNCSSADSDIAGVLITKRSCTDTGSASVSAACRYRSIGYTNSSGRSFSSAADTGSSAGTCCSYISGFDSDRTAPAVFTAADPSAVS